MNAPLMAEKMLADPVARRAQAATVPQTNTVCHRTFMVERAAIDTAARTCELSFSSEMPYERYWGTEILDHSPGSCDLTRLNQGGALLVNHDRDQQVGCVVAGSARMGTDRKGRAQVRFSQSECGSEVFQDVQDGIRSLVSVGYLINDMVLESTSDQEDVYRVTRWTPFEISIVSIPADPSVGVGRAASPTAATKPTTGATMPQEDRSTNTVVDPAQVTAQVRQAELERAKEIRAIAAQFKQTDLGEQFVQEGKGADEFRKAVLDKVHAEAQRKGEEAGKIGLTDREARDFSFVRLINALANPQDRAAHAAAAFEREVSEAAQKKAGKTARGFLVPTDVLRASMLGLQSREGGSAAVAQLMSRMLQRDLVVGTSTAGGHTVATDLMAASFIELLRNRMVVQRLGATVLNDLSGNIAVPRQTSGATAYWVAESGSPTESQQAVDQVTMSPKTLGAYTDYSRKLLLQSSIDVEAFVRMDITKVIGLEADRAALYGSGSANQPTGVKNQSSIHTVDFAAATPTFAEVVSLETAIAADNADIGTMAYLVNATGRGALKTAVKVTNQAQFIWEPGNTINGYRAEVSNQVASGDHWFANWADLVIGMWSGLDIMVDPYTGSTSGTVRIVALQDCDIAVRHPVSFCRGNDTL